MNWVPEQIGRYRIDGVMGRGAMGVVYRGHDEGIDRPVAIKTIHAELLAGRTDSDWHERFRREARAAARCQHPNIVTIYEFGDHEGVPFMAMEFISGPTLQSALEKGPWPGMSRSLHLVRQVLDAIGYAHQRGIIHRDLKPANIMLVDDDYVKVTDFGIARLDQSQLTVSGAVVGTPGYMAFEQINGGTVDERADLFAIGVLLYQLLTGCMPYPGDTLPSIVYSMLTTEPAEPTLLNPNITPALSEIVKRALASDASQRYQSAADFAAALFPRAGRGNSGVVPAITAARPAPGSGPRPEPRRPTGVGIGPQGTSRGGPVSRAGGGHLAGPPAGTPTRSLGGARPSSDLTPGRPPGTPIGPGRSGPQPGLGTPLPSSFAEADLARVTRELTPIVGPIAALLVKKTAAKVATLADLYRALCAHIPDDKERAAFLRGGGL